MVLRSTPRMREPLRCRGQVGHTGDLKAVVRACTTVDRHLGDLLETVEKMGGRWLVSSDHGNADDMVQARRSYDSVRATRWIS